MVRQGTTSRGLVLWMTVTLATTRLCAGDANALLDALRREGLNQYAHAFEYAGMVDTLLGPGRGTLLGPTDDAFQAFFNELTAQMLDVALVEDLPQDIWSKILPYHVLPDPRSLCTQGQKHSGRQGLLSPVGPSSNSHIFTTVAPTINCELHVDSDWPNSLQLGSQLQLDSSGTAVMYQLSQVLVPKEAAALIADLPRSPPGDPDSAERFPAYNSSRYDVE